MTTTIPFKPGPHLDRRLKDFVRLSISEITIQLRHLHFAVAIILLSSSGCITTYSFGLGTRTNPTPMESLPQVARVQVVGNRVHVEGSERLANYGEIVAPITLEKGDRFRTRGFNHQADYRFIEIRDGQIVFDRHDSSGGCAAFLIFVFFHDHLDTIAVRPYDLADAPSSNAVTQSMN